jgi:hypothetical protein
MKILFAVNLVYNKVIDNFLILLVLNFHDNRPNGFLSYSCLKLVFRTSCSLKFLDQFLEMYLFDPINLGIILRYLKMFYRQFHNLSRKSCFIFVGCV